MPERFFGSQLEMMLLACLGAGPLHGYAIIERLRQASKGAFSLPEGTIYPALHRLENMRLVGSQWADRGGRRSRVYRLTAIGSRSLAERKEVWQRFRKGVESVLEGA